MKKLLIFVVVPLLCVGVFFYLKKEKVDTHNHDRPQPTITATETVDPSIQPNAYFETFMKEESENKLYKFNIKLPKADMTYTVQEEGVELEFVGEIIAEVLNERTRLRLDIFPSQSPVSLGNQPVFKTLLPLDKTGKGLHFGLSKTLDLPKGLYYYMLTIDKNETPDFCGKILVE